MQRRPSQKRDRQIIEPPTVDLQDSEVGVWRQQAPQQIDRESHIEETEIRDEGEKIGDAGVEGPASGCHGTNGRNVEL